MSKIRELLPFLIICNEVPHATLTNTVSVLVQRARYLCTNLQEIISMKFKRRLEVDYPKIKEMRLKMILMTFYYTYALYF